MSKPTPKPSKPEVVWVVVDSAGYRYFRTFRYTRRRAIETFLTNICLPGESWKSLYAQGYRCEKTLIARYEEE